MSYEQMSIPNYKAPPQEGENMTAQDYPVTFGYGATDPPYGTAQDPYHRGEDRYMPVGTPILVNGVQIGLSGKTGFVTGPHLHIGRFIGSQDTPPNGGGFSFNSATVTQVGEDAKNGKYVRVQADNASWVYLHMSQQTASVGQTLIKEESMTVATGKETTEAFLKYQGSEPTKDQYVFYTTHDASYLYRDLADLLHDRLKANPDTQKLQEIKQILG